MTPEIRRGDQVRHKTRGMGTLERVHRNALGKIVRADVRFNGALVANLWAEDLALMTGGVPAFAGVAAAPAQPASGA